MTIAKIVWAIFWCIYLWQVTYCNEQVRWQVLIYMEVGDNLSDVALKSLHDLTLENTSQKVSVCVQVHTHGQQAWRYRITHNALLREDSISLATDMADTITQAAQWAFSQDAEHHMLIFYGHAYGILNPTWDKITQNWCFEEDNAYKSSYWSYDSQVNSIDQEWNTYYHMHHRALLSTKDPRTYVTNTQLLKALNTISTSIINKKIAIVGIDACMMAMVEVAYELSPFVNYLVASQECELKDGWDYKALIGSLSNKEYTPEQISKEIVLAYDRYYSQRISYYASYTQSALKLSNMRYIKEHIVKLVTHIHTYSSAHKKLLKSVLYKARIISPRFCFIAMYTDMYTFYQYIMHYLGHLEGDHPLKQLIPIYNEGIALLNTIIIAKCSGSLHTQVKGLSIYCPYAHIDSSYSNTFETESCWKEFIRFLTEQ